MHYDEITGNMVGDDVGPEPWSYRPVYQRPAQVPSGAGEDGWWHILSRLALGGVLGFVFTHGCLLDKSGKQTQSPPCDTQAALEMELPGHRDNFREFWKFPESVNEIPDNSKLVGDIDDRPPSRYHSKRPWEEEGEDKWRGAEWKPQLIVVCCECGTHLDASEFMRWKSFDCVCPACNAKLHVEQ